MNTLNHFLTISVAAGIILGGSSLNSYAQSVDNQAYIKQVSFENRAEIMQGALLSNDFAKENIADVYQDGFNNEALIRQAHNGGSTSIRNTAKTVQRDEQHKVEISQGINGGLSEINTAETSQRGDFHTALIQQGNDGVAVNNSASVQQLDDSNLAVIIQGADGGEAENNEATIKQDGTSYTALIRQGTNFNEAKENQAEIIQKGDSGNEGVIIQGSSGAEGVVDDGDAFSSFAKIMQDGEVHYALSIQNNSTTDVVEISQRGSGHFARVAQGIVLP